MKSAVIIFIHAGYWSLYLLLIAVILAVAGIQSGKTPFLLPSLFPLIVLCVAPNLISFYSFYLLLFPAFLRRRKFFLLIVFGAFVCLLSAFASALLSLPFYGFRQAIFADRRELFTLAASFFAIAAIHGVIALVIRGFVGWFEEVKLKEELARKNLETEIALLKSQINPHFLFNTLNNIDVLISKDQAKASQYLNKLSGILRYLVYETKSETISLNRELNYIEQYIALEKIRAVNSDYINFQAAGGREDFQIAPMILFPFVENAFKHTENRKISNSIRINVVAEKDKLTFECENFCQPKRNAQLNFGGSGNELMRKRLALLYPNRHVLEIDDRGEIYKVKLTLL